MALGVGGLAQLLAGMWEFAAANTFGATGGFHLIYFEMIRFVLSHCTLRLLLGPSV